MTVPIVYANKYKNLYYKRNFRIDFIQIQTVIVSAKLIKGTDNSSVLFG